MDIILRFVFLWLLICSAVDTRCSKDVESKRTLDIIRKLCNLGEMRPLKCVTEAENMNTPIPKFPKQEEIRLSVLRMSYRILSDLMRNASIEWNTSRVHDLQELLGHQRQFYATCVPISGAAPEEKWSAFWSNVSHYLSEKSFSSCAWESARSVILHVMRKFRYRSTLKSLLPIISC